MIIKVVAVLICLFGIACTVIGVGSLQMIDTSVVMMEQMRDAGSRTLDGVDFSVMRIVLYINGAFMTLIGVLSLLSGIGIFFKKNWARLLWIGTIVLMSAWGTYSFVMSSINRGIEIESVSTTALTLIILAAVIYFFARKRTKDYFEVN